jgi:hypothetical protein
MVKQPPVVTELRVWKVEERDNYRDERVAVRERYAPGDAFAHDGELRLDDLGVLEAYACVFVQVGGLRGFEVDCDIQV